MFPELGRLKLPISVFPEYVASSDTTFLIQQQGKAASSTKFTIFKPETDNVTEKSPSDTLLSVDGEYFDKNERRIFYNASGEPVFEISHSSSSSTWHIQRPGRDSPSIGFLEPQDSMFKDDYKIQVRNAAAGGEDTLLRVQGQDIWKLRTNVLLGDKVVMTAKRNDKLSVYIPRKKVEWVVDVAEGFDMALASAIIVVMGANMYTNGKSKGYIYVG